jgi:hypothetical protein
MHRRGMTRGITERYLGFEAAGLKARSENPAYRYGAATARNVGDPVRAGDTPRSASGRPKTVDR